jgi:putative ABC transport system permease protein
MGALWQDLRYAFRAMARTPRFSLVAVLCVALGITAITTIFSVVQGALLRPFPYHRPEMLASLWQENRNDPLYATAKLISYPNFCDCRRATHKFQDIAGVSLGCYTMSYRNTSESVYALEMTSNLLGLLGVQPLLGRGFLPEEDQSGVQQVVILTNDCWKNWFGSDPNVLGDSIFLKSAVKAQRSYTIVGIMPPGFTQPFYPMTRAGILMLLEPRRDSELRQFCCYSAVGRLRAGVTIREAQAELAGVSRQLEKGYPRENEGLLLRTKPLRAAFGGDVGRVLYLFLGASGFLLMIACGNVAVLLLIRGLERRREIAVRVTLGAGRLHVLRQLVLEGLLLAVLGLLASIFASVWILGGLRSLIAAFVPAVGGMQVDLKTLSFAGSAGVIAGAAFGLIPALQVWRTDLCAVLRGTSGHITSGTRTQHAYLLLVACQTALAFVLLLGAGLAIRTFANLMRVDPGFNPHNVLTMRIDFSEGKYRSTSLDAFHSELLVRLRQLPGVISATTSDSLPLGSQGSTFTFQMEGLPGVSPNAHDSYCSWVSQDYFRTLGVPLVMGRDFRATDLNRPVVIVNKAWAQSFSSSRNPVGEQLKDKIRGDSYEIVGVAENERYRDEQFTGELAIAPRAYFHRSCPLDAYLTIRAAVDPLALIPPVRAVLRELDNRVLVSEMRTMEDRVRDTCRSQKLTMLLVTLFAALGLTLSTVGLYGAMAHLAHSRLREAAIRMAMGARPSDIFKMVLSRGAKVTALGMAIGLISMFALVPIVASHVYGVAPLDPLNLLAAALFLMVASTLATFLPACRAARAEPMTVLRQE